jgi:alpha-acetolactate decarboxylase
LLIVGIAFSRRSQGYYPAFAAASAEYAGEVGSLYLFNRQSSIDNHQSFDPYFPAKGRNTFVINL